MSLPHPPKTQVAGNTTAPCYIAPARATTVAARSPIPPVSPILFSSDSYNTYKSCNSELFSLVFLPEFISGYENIMNVTENTMVLSITHLTFVDSNSHMEQLTERLVTGP